MGIRDKLTLLAWLLWKGEGKTRLGGVSSHVQGRKQLPNSNLISYRQEKVN